MEEVTNKVIVSVQGDDTILDYSDLNLNFDSSENDVLETLRPIILESHGVDIKDGSSWLFKTRKALTSQNIHIIPNAVAG